MTIGGALTNSNTIQIGTGYFNLSAPTTVTAANLTNTTTGTIDLYGNASEGTTNQATLDITSGAAPATWTGAANLGGDALLEFASGQITRIASGATLTLNNLNGAPSRVADASDTTSNSALAHLASNAGTFVLENGNGLADQATSTFANSGSFGLYENTTFSTPAGVGFTNSGGFGIDTGSGQGGSTVTIGGALTNSNTIQIGTGYFNLSAPTTVTAANLTNTTTGTIDLYSNASEGTTNQATLDITSGAAPATWTGAANLGGDALLEFASGQITSIAAGATLTLNNNVNGAPYQNNPGAPSRVADASDTTSNSALTQLASNAGTFELVNGAALAACPLASNSGTFEIINDPGLADQATSSLTNSGTFVRQDITSFSTLAGVGFANSGGFYVDNGSGQGGSTVTIGGALTNSNTIQIGTGYFNLSAPTTVSAGALVNDGGATFSIYGSASYAATVKADGQVSNSGTFNLGSYAVFDLIGKGAFSQSASGSFSEGSAAMFSIASGDTVTLSGTTSLSGKVSGKGTLALAGGSTTIGTGASLHGFATWTVSGSGTSVTLSENLTYAGTFSAGAGTTLNLSGGNLTLTGKDSFVRRDDERFAYA